MNDRKVAIVTGAGSGIGKATAAAFIRDGWAVAFLGRREAALQDALSAGEGEKTGSIAVTCDVTNASDVDRAFNQIAETLGRVDLLFNNAGVSYGPYLPDEFPADEWDKTIAVNLSGAFYCARAAFRQMRRQTPQGGRIINNGSVSAQAPRPGSAAYTASKHAVTGLTRSLALDGRPFGIACGQIDIGNALTDMAEEMTQGVPQADGSMKVEPTIEVQHVANSVLHMASLPLGANVLFMNVMATNMPLVGRG